MWVCDVLPAAVHEGVDPGPEVEQETARRANPLFGFLSELVGSQRLPGVGSWRHTSLKEVAMWRLYCVLVVAVVALGVAAPPVASVPKHKLGGILGALWETVLETPTPQNPFAGGDPCVDLGGVVAPFAPPGTLSLTCTVKPGTKLFITAWSSECSTVEPPPFFGRNEAELRACARAADAGITRHEITLDGRPVPVSEVESGLLTIDLPADNILGVPAQRAFSVAHGWVALLHPLTPGTHEIVLDVEGTDVFGMPVDFTNTTTIIVKPGHKSTRLPRRM